MQLRTSALLVVAAMSLGCAVTDSDSVADATTSDAGATGSPSSTDGTQRSDTGPGPVADSGSSGSTQAGGLGSTGETGLDPEGAECDAEAQDCPDAYKCVLRRGARDWEFVCLPVVGEGEPGDECTHDGVLTGTDTCNEDTWCIGSFDTTGRPWTGICYPLCVGDVCESSDDVCVGIGALPVCAPACDPLLPGSCGGSESCILRGYEDGFVCFPSGADAHPVGEPCETGISCVPGLHCSQNVAGCTPEEYCCTDLCDTTVAEVTCAEAEAGAQCVAIGVEAPGQEHVGACVVP